MKKSILAIIAFVIIGIVGCTPSSSAKVNIQDLDATESSGIETMTSTDVTVAETALPETQETKTSEIETAEPETTKYEPIFEDITLALDCQRKIDVPESVDVTFESAQPEIVSVDNDGILTARIVGAANITVYIDKESYTFEAVVTTPEISTTTIMKIVGNTEQISFYGTNGVPIFKSDNTAIATVTEKGLVTAEPSGAGQSTKIHALIDGKEFIVDVIVEPVPQLLSTYKIYGYQKQGVYWSDSYTRNFFTNAKIELIGNTNEIAYDTSELYTPHYKTETVLDMGAVDYSPGNVYPLYYTYDAQFDYKGLNYAQIYLLGSSQDASVVIKPISGAIGEATGSVKYTPCEGYGIIEVWSDFPHYFNIVTVSIDGYTYEFAIDSLQNFNYDPDFERNVLPGFVVSSCTVDDEIISVSTDYSGVKAKSSTFYGSEFASDLGSKIIEAVEDEAISFIVGKVFSLVF